MGTFISQQPSLASPLPSARPPTAWETSRSANAHGEAPQNPPVGVGGRHACSSFVQEQLQPLVALAIQQQLQNKTKSSFPVVQDRHLHVVRPPQGKG